MKQDYRQKPRRALRYRAWLEGIGDAPAHCTFSDVSESGARLRIQRGMVVPDTVGLRLTKDGALRPCHVVWRSESEVGLQFDCPATAQKSLNRR